MILMQNIIDDDKSLLTVLLGSKAMKHLKCKADDYLFVMQSNFKSTYFILVKSDNGYRIRRYPKMKKTYQVNVMYNFKYIPEFDFTECIYFMRSNNSIRVSLNV